MSLTRNNPKISRRVLIYAMDKALIPMKEGTDKVIEEQCRIIGTDPTGVNLKFPCTRAAIAQAVGRNDAGKPTRAPFHLLPEHTRFLVCLDDAGRVVRTDTISDIEPSRLERSKDGTTVDVRVESDALGTLRVENYPQRFGFEAVRRIVSSMSDVEAFKVGDAFGAATISAIEGNLVRLTPEVTADES
jgi:hypothetical protein